MLFKKITINKTININLFYVLMLFSVPFFSFGQQTINGTLTHGGMQRTYILYVPATYSAANAAPLVMNFHGYTSNANDQMFYGDFRPIADTAGFLLVMPQGTTDFLGNTYWNANWGGSADDVSFTEALLNELSSNYNIDQDKVYSTGMSNGGYFSYYLACNLSHKIAAIASVTGAMTKGTPATCNPQHPTPVLEIHGDADATVPYSGGVLNESTQAGLDYWIGYNNTNTTPSFAAIPDINTADNCTVEHYVYANGDNCVEVEHYKILNGGHTWPGAPINTGSGETNHDIEASLLIWEFFLQYDLGGKIGCTTTDVENFDKASWEVFPNPASDFLTLEWNNSAKITTVVVKDVLGKEILQLNTNGRKKITIDTKKMNKGLYFIGLTTHTGLVHTKKVLLK